MKVEGKEEFSPITITLETKEEAILMWGALNIKNDELLDALSELEYKHTCKTTYSMFCSFNRVFDPRKYNE